MSRDTDGRSSREESPEQRPLISIPNAHPDNEPPQLNCGDYDYISFFVTQDGNQRIFIFDTADQVGFLYRGENWSNPTELPADTLSRAYESEAAVLAPPTTPSEQHWLNGCLAAISPLL
jgi:hypothetical protein